MRDAETMMMRTGGRGLVMPGGPFRTDGYAGRIEGDSGRGAGEKGLQHERIDREGREAQPQEASHVSCPLAHQGVKTSKAARVKPRPFTSQRVTLGQFEMAGRGAFSAGWREAWQEARTRVFGSGFDRSFRIVLLVAYLAGGLFLAHRGGGIAPSSIVTGLVAMALFLAMPLVTIFVYMLGLSYLARLAGVPDDADPPMRAVFAAFAVALVAGACFVGGSFSLPVVGAQLRLIFS